MAYKNVRLFAGNANVSLAENISSSIEIPLGKADVGRFSDGEIMVQINESVRGKDVYVLQPTCTPEPAVNLMELLVMIDALKRASAKRITAVVPYYGFARQDRRPHSARVPITARLAADMITVAGADRVITVDLHADQIQGFFDIPVDNIYGSPTLVADMRTSKHIVEDDMMVVSPDMGGVVRARAVAKALGCDMAIIDKRRPKANVAQIMNIIGDVAGRDCILVDDMVDTAGTLCKAAQALMDHGAKSVTAYVVHAVLSGPAVENINNSALTELVVTDTIPLSIAAIESSKIRQVTIAPMLGETIRRVHQEESVSEIMPIR
ncbi:ribose-phosphate pyrophosphokinase [Hydrogenovibrio sp. JE_KL2]|jgi:ribose-phosphate pyrophosphokinase|uniref:ribose-phosphate pyrophosphokinase n=1 Tax=Hydrogenovibrio sp. JE_KL2 TaxID=2651188 RepID=UPI00128D9892|nr:ribose-phosphate pyrophosphokinase [Hydrogenovibrio sp. JE_KL2]MBN2606438.1 ribose-phosphate pyrophosphokinase [Thiotrichales bacterium]MPQ77508.1 ribose-phosphate pyrophosphokinase [Hydrogenovibrio sp. JE_KL2]